MSSTSASPMRNSREGNRRNGDFYWQARTQGATMNKRFVTRIPITAIRASNQKTAVEAETAPEACGSFIKTMTIRMRWLRARQAHSMPNATAPRIHLQNREYTLNAALATTLEKLWWKLTPVASSLRDHAPSSGMNDTINAMPLYLRDDARVDTRDRSALRCRRNWSTARQS